MNKQSLPWIEKYRPRRTDDIIQHDSIRAVCSNIKKNKNMPNMLFHGPPGTGKTSVAFALSMELYGPRSVKDSVLELNASDDRGIKMVRNKIIKFSKMSMGDHDPKYSCPPFRMIILDEVDAMTKDAQAALRKVMEDSIETTRFILICNHENDIIDAIKSRCTKFIFSVISIENTIAQLKKIAKLENLEIDKDALLLIAEIRKGDIRSCINTLQNLKYKNKKINVKDVKSITSFIDGSDIKNLWETVINSNYKSLYKEVGLIVRNAYPIEYMFNAIMVSIDGNKTLNNLEKMSIYEHLAHIERRTTEGGDDFIQLLSLLTYINGIIRKKIEITQILTF